MIHRDLCDPTNTKLYSPLRMQFHFLLSRFHCWDGFIPLTRKEMAIKLECDIQSIDKFIKKGIQEGIFRLDGSRLYLLKTVEDHLNGYVKHYPFLESAAFRSLHPHAQRFVLYCLWAGVHTGRTLKVGLTNLYHSTKEYQGKLNLYSRRGIYQILEEAKRFLKLEIILEENGKDSGKLKVRVTGLQDTYAQQEALVNEGETKNLLNLFADHGCDEIVSQSSIIELLKIKKHYVQNIGSIGAEMFSHALLKLMTLHKLFELNSRGEVGQYFKSIMQDLEEKIVPTLQKRVQYIKQAITQTKDLLLTTTSQIVLKTFESTKKKLEHGLSFLLSKNKKESPINFPFYNWLENDTQA